MTLEKDSIHTSWIAAASRRVRGSNLRHGLIRLMSVQVRIRVYTDGPFSGEQKEQGRVRGCSCAAFMLKDISKTEREEPGTAEASHSSCSSHVVESCFDTSKTTRRQIQIHTQL